MTRRIFPVVLILAALWSAHLSACTSADSPFPWERKGARRGDQARQWAQSNANPFPAAGAKPPKDRYSSVEGTGRVVSMTFDDGPRPWTMDLLDMLREREIRATFFVVGEAVKAYPHVVKRMAAEGHEVANHTWSHPLLARMPEAFVRRQLQMTHDLIEEVAGVTPRLMRPPGGSITREQSKWIYDEFDYVTVMWSVDPEDWKRPGPSAIRERIVEGWRRSRGAHDGAIILAHDLHEPTVRAMPATLDALMAEGYRFLTTSQLLALDYAEAEILLLQPEEIDPAWGMEAPAGPGERLPRVKVVKARVVEVSP